MLDLSELIDQTIQLANRVSRPGRPVPAGVRSGGGLLFSTGAGDGKESDDADTDASRLAEYLSASIRGSAPLIFSDRPRDIPTAFDGVVPSALGIMVKAGGADVAASDGPAEGVAVCISTFTHELKQLRYNRPGVPLCQQGHDCVARQIPGAAMLGPLPIYLTPTEQVELETTGLNRESIRDSMPRQCLLCIRRMVDCVRMACEHASALDGVGRNFVRAPFTNPVGVDGYRDAAIGVRPHHHCISGGASIVRSDIPVWVEYDKLSSPEGFIVVQDPACVHTEATAPPCL